MSNNYFKIDSKCFYLLSNKCFTFQCNITLFIESLINLFEIFCSNMLYIVFNAHKLLIYYFFPNFIIY